MKDVKLYGPGCARCEATARMAQEAAAKLGVAVAVEKVTDPRAIAIAGVTSTPGVAVEGKLLHAGGLPDATRLEGCLR